MTRRGQHRQVVVVVAEGHHVLRIDAQGGAEPPQAEALVRQREIQPAVAGDGGVEHLAEVRREYGYQRLRRAGAVSRDLHHRLGHILRPLQQHHVVAHAVAHERDDLRPLGAEVAGVGAGHEELAVGRFHDLPCEGHRLAVLHHHLAEHRAGRTGAKDHRPVFAYVVQLPRQRCEQPPQAAVLPAAGRRKDDALGAQARYLFKNGGRHRPVRRVYERAVDVADDQAYHTLLPFPPVF